MWLDRGVTRRIERGFAAFEEWRDQVLEEEEREQHKLDRKIVAEEHWMRYGVTARRKRNMRRVGLLAAMRKDFREHRGAIGAVKIAVTEAELSGKLVVEAERISKSFGENADRARLFRSASSAATASASSARTAPARPRCSKLLTGELAPDDGTVTLGANLADGDARPAPRHARPEHVGARHADRRARRHRCSSAGRRATSSAT